jgi:hypothetical protein
MALELAGTVRGGLGCLARVVQRTVCGWLLAVVVPAIPLGAEDLIHAEDEAVAVEALAAIDLEYLTRRQFTECSRFRTMSRSAS